MQTKPANFAAIRINTRIEDARTADPDAKPTEIQDMMIGEIRKHYRALLEKRGASMPLSGAVIEDVATPAVSLATAEVDTETGEILALESRQDGEGDAGNLLASADDEQATLQTTDLEPELGFMADLAGMLGENDMTSTKDGNEQ
jgi:hypothetical protein